MIRYPEPRDRKTVRGGGNVELEVQSWGQADGFPILFIHAFSQSHLTWWQQVVGRLSTQFNLVTFDLRGHGNSAKPIGAEHYSNGELFAEDVKAVIDICKLRKPIVVAWSIGGIVLDDYLAKYGDDNLSGLFYLGAAHQLGVQPGYVGSAFMANAAGMLSSDLATNVTATIAAGKLVTANMTDPSMFTFVIATNMVVPPYVRAGMLNRSVDHIENTLQTLSVPAYFIHGKADQIILPDSSITAAAATKDGKLTLLDDVGHAPHIEVSELLAAELSQFISELQKESRG